MQDDITWADCGSSQFLSVDDIVPRDGRTVKIEGFEKRLIEGRNGQPDKNKVCVKFEEFEKLLVLNRTNGTTIKRITGSDLPVDSIGHEVEVYVEQNIPFGTKMVEGIRLRELQEIPA